MQIAQTMTCVMPCYSSRKMRAHVLNFENIYKKRAEFMCFRRYLISTGPPGSVIREELMEMLDHCRARSGRADDRICIRVLKDLDKSPGKLSCFTTVAGIECRLAAPRLALVKNNLATCTSQDFDCARANVRTKLIDKTGDKKSNLHG